MNVILGYKFHGVHLSSSLSCVELLTTLLHFQKKEDCDVVVSKGHAAAAWYCALVENGYLRVDDLNSFGAPNSRLGIHVSKHASSNTLLTSGSLGHGLPFALGVSIAKQLKNSMLIHPTFVVLGDGETNEGSNWEAALIAGAKQTPGIVCIIDLNRVQAVGTFLEINGKQDLKEKFEAFAWKTHWVNAHEPEAILMLLQELDYSVPNMILSESTEIAPFYEFHSHVKWHYAKIDEYDFVKKTLSLRENPDFEDIFETLK